MSLGNRSNMSSASRGTPRISADFTPPGQGQAPAFMTPEQRLARMPQQALPALTRAAPQPFFGTQPPIQSPAQLPNMQTQQAIQPVSGLTQLPGTQMQQVTQQPVVNSLFSSTTVPQFDSRASVFSGANPFPQGSTLANDWDKWRMYEQQNIDPYSVGRENFPTLRSLLDSLSR